MTITMTTSDDPFTGLPAGTEPEAAGGFVLPGHIPDGVVPPEPPDEGEPATYRARPKKRRRRRRREPDEDLIPILVATMAADDEESWLWL